MNALVCAVWYTCSPFFLLWFLWALFVPRACLSHAIETYILIYILISPHRLNAEEDSLQRTRFFLNTYKRLIFCTDKGVLDG